MYQITISDIVNNRSVTTEPMEYDNARRLYARLIREPVETLYGGEGLSWSGWVYPSCGLAVDLHPQRLEAHNA